MHRGITSGETRLYVINFYIEQLERFNKIGIGNKSEFGVRITQSIIDKTQERLWELKCSSIKNKIISQEDLYKRGNRNIDLIHKTIFISLLVLFISFFYFILLRLFHVI